MSNKHFLLELEELRYWVDHVASPGDVAVHFNISTGLTYVYSYEGPDENPQWILSSKTSPAQEELPTKTGRWIPVSQKPGVYAGMKCSNCKAKISYKDYYSGQHNYCHRCGAKMIEEEDYE